MKLQEKLFIIFIISFSVVSSKHQKGSFNNVRDDGEVQRFVVPKQLSPEDMPTLNDDGPQSKTIFKKSSHVIRDSELPGAYGEEDESIDPSERNGRASSGSGSASGSGDSDEEENVFFHSKVSHHPHIPEHAARFGNNVKVLPGINPSAAFVTQEQNHRGFKGRDKDVREKKRKSGKKSKVKKKMKQANGRLTKHVTNDDVDDDDDDDGSGVHKEDADIIKQIKNIAKEIDKVEKKRKEKEQEKEQEKKRVETIKTKDLPLEDISTKNSNGKKKSDNNVLYPHEEVKGPEGFECPWSCYWTCQSYCPKECCNNPYNCSDTCREICTPYCKDRCCAPGVRRLPKLSLPLLSSAKYKSKTEQPVDTSNNEIVTKIKALKDASDYAARLLGVNTQCPAFCSKVCTMSLCQPHCCERRSQSALQEANYATKQFPTPLSRRESFLRSYPTLPQNPIANLTNVVESFQSAASGIQASIKQSSPVYCPSPRDCPEGGIVDPNYCPPICRSSCIEQCPNECCPNYGRKV